MRPLNGRNSTRCLGWPDQKARCRCGKRPRQPRRAGNGFQKARDKRPKIAQCGFPDWQRLRFAALNPAKARRFEAFGVALETLETERSAWWRTQSQSNLSPLPNSLLTGKRTGNFAKSRLRERQRLQIILSLQGFPYKFPTQRNRELFWRNTEFWRKNREFYRPNCNHCRMKFPAQWTSGYVRYCSNSGKNVAVPRLSALCQKRTSAARSIKSPQAAVTGLSNFFPMTQLCCRQAQN